MGPNWYDKEMERIEEDYAAAQIDRARNHFAADPSATREVIRTAARDLARA
jgi:hypothetical protein